MKVKFSNQIKIAGIGLVPWARLGPEQWLTDYTIASLYNWDLPSNSRLPKVHALSNQSESLPKLSRLNTQNLLENSQFQALLKHQLPGHSLLVYKPIKPPKALKDYKFLMTKSLFTDTYENKVFFRQLFGQNFNFPSFKIYKKTDLELGREDYANLMAGRSKIVIQDEKLSGAKGTFKISSYEQYKSAIAAVKNLSKQPKVVVSDFIESAKERSLQACVTDKEIIIGPMQRQIVANPLLVRPEIPGDKFCGATILASDQKDVIYQQLVGTAKKIGRALQRDNYRGIFGVDFLLDRLNQVYVLEVNTRITGVTPLLTALSKLEKADIPFYLLHLLELGGYKYEITNHSICYDHDGSLLILHSLENRTVIIKSMPKSGTYKIINNRLTMLSRNIYLDKIKGDEFIFEEYMPNRTTIKPGGRQAVLLFRRSVIDETTDKLHNDIVNILSIVRNGIITRAI